MTVLNADGSRTESVTVTDSDGTLQHKGVVTTSNDREKVSITRDLNRDGITDQTEIKVTLGNGNVVQTRSNLTSTGMLINKDVETSGPSGLSWTLQHDLNRDESIDRGQARNAVFNADGSRTTTFSDKSYSGTGEPFQH